jgi:hypothetical protein
MPEPIVASTQRRLVQHRDPSTGFGYAPSRRSVMAVDTAKRVFGQAPATRWTWWTSDVPKAQCLVIWNWYLGTRFRSVMCLVCINVRR